ncbi:baseplate J-like protein [Acetobacteraceae bacterium AT-5844]|nr:baseplate J-like protein [Acetobacteraceae bacterium AT-5844]
MPYQRPTLRSLFSQASADMAESTGNFVLLRTSPLRIIAKVLAGLVDGLYGYLDWIARMAVPVTARDEFLRAWAALVGIFQKEATTAAGSVALTGTPGAILKEGTQLARQSDGALFATTALGTVPGSGTLIVPVRALAAGAGGNTLAGAAMIITSAAQGINAAGLAATAIAGGADAEDEESLRARMLDRYQNPPQGGAASDYVTWALEVAGVTRAWCAPNGAGAGTVVVYIMLDDAQAAHGGFPQGSDGVASDEGRDVPATGDQLVVANALYPQRPATALVYVVAPVPYSIHITLDDLAADTAEIRDGIKASLRGMLQRQGEPGGVIYPSDINEAIRTVAGVERFTLTWPNSAVILPTGRLPILGSINDWS